MQPTSLQGKVYKRVQKNLFEEVGLAEPLKPKKGRKQVLVILWLILEWFQ